VSPPALETYAGFWIRFCAWFIDSIFVGFAFALPLAMLFPRAGLLSTSTCIQFVSGMCVSSETTYVLAATTLPDLLVTGFYFVLTWWLLGGTAGQRLLNLHVVDQTTGGRISFRQSVGRFCGYLLSIWLLCLGLIWVGVDTYKQGWHDKLAHTDVIRRYRF
jgi:uncharacterized RDD family membrane protein YckC